jgi:hypothetical protein
VALIKIAGCVAPADRELAEVVAGRDPGRPRSRPRRVDATPIMSARLRAFMRGIVNRSPHAEHVRGLARDPGQGEQASARRPAKPFRLHRGAQRIDVFANLCHHRMVRGQRPFRYDQRALEKGDRFGFAALTRAE